MAFWVALTGLANCWAMPSRRLDSCCRTASQSAAEFLLILPRVALPHPRDGNPGLSDGTFSRFSISPESVREEFIRRLFLASAMRALYPGSENSLVLHYFCLILQKGRATHSVARRQKKAEAPAQPPSKFIIQNFNALHFKIRVAPCSSVVEIQNSSFIIHHSCVLALF